MADVTARLLWYRLSESSEHLLLIWDGISFVVDAGGTVLNYMFLCWLLFGILTIVIVSVIQHHEAGHHSQTNHFNRPDDYVCKKCKGNFYREGQMIKTSLSKNCIAAAPEVPHIEWQNVLLQWLNNRDAQWKTLLLESLLATMTEESRKLGGDLFVTFEAFLPAGDAPLLNITKVEPDAADSTKLVLQGDFQLSGLQLSLTVSDNAVSIHSNLLLIIHLIKLQLVIEVESKADVISLMVRAGEITNSDIQFCPYHQGVDCVTDERKLTHHVSAIFTQTALPINLNLKTDDDKRPPIHKERTPSDSLGGSRPPKPPRSMEDKRLMIKLIKATKLNKRNIGILMDENLIVKVRNARGLHAWKFFATMDAYCIVEVDNPYQTHSTSVVRNTVNPYWDEHFLFDLGIYTKMVTFRVYGSSKDTDDNRNCLGECQLKLEKLRVNHGVRMVLPLESRPDMSDLVSGSVTVEAFFVDAAEFEPSSTPEIDDVFAQSIEPLTSLHSDADIESPLSEQVSMNGDSRLSSLSLTGSTSKIIKTSTYVQKDRLSYGSQNSGSMSGVEKAETIQNVSNGASVTSENVQEPLSGVDLGNAEALPGVDLGNAGLGYRGSASPSEDFKKPRFSMTLGRKRASWLSLKVDRPHSFTVEIITVYPNQSVTDVVMRELKERAKKPKPPGGHTTSTIIITAASRMPQTEQPLISLASLESLSDDSSGGTPSINWDVSQQQQQFQHQQPHTPPPSQQPPSEQPPSQQPPLQQPPPQLPQYQLPQPNEQLNVSKSSEPPPSVERKSRLSVLKKRFTRTKDKKPRSHSIERSSGIDEHRYLEPSYNDTLESSASDAMLGGPSSKKKFGGSLRKLFRFGSRSSSSSRQKHLHSDNERLYDGYGDYGRRLSVEGSRPEHYGSRSSLERSMTPPHHRALSASSSYGYGPPSPTPVSPHRSKTVEFGASIRPAAYDRH